jgi:superfamily II DNA/RNA helicase
MEQIASLEKLKKHLSIIHLSDDYVSIQNLITELHFSYENFRFEKSVPDLSEQRVLWKSAHYLFTALTNPLIAASLSDTSLQDGLAIAALIFELLGRYSEARENSSLQKDCFLNAAICNTLSRYEANSIVLSSTYFDRNLVPADRKEYLSKSAEYGMNTVFALLARKFFWIQRFAHLNSIKLPQEVNEILASTGNEYTEEGAFWSLTCQSIGKISDFMIGGLEKSYNHALLDLKKARRIARECELLSEHWLVSRLLDCTKRMVGHSAWRILREQGFSEEYISTLTRFPWNSVHELWQSQIQALTAVETPGQSEENNILSDSMRRAVVSMPTSAGKTLLAEMTIVKTLQNGRGQKCVYVAPTRALVDELEEKLHRRLRFLDYRVASVVGGFEIDIADPNYLEENIDVAVLTPEKLDYLIRKRDPFIEHIALFIFDEVHKVSEGSRGWFLETLITWLLLKPKLKDSKMIFMSAVLPRTQQPLVRMWIGQQSLAPLATSEWSPTRQLIGILKYNDLELSTKDWRNPIRRDAKGNEYYWGQSADLVFRYDIGTEYRVLEGLYKLAFWGNRPKRKFKWLGREEEDRYDRCLKLVKHLGAENSILVYFQEKVNLVRFCQRVPDYLDRVDDPNLARLVSYIVARLGEDFPLVSSLPYGVAFHHGDLPLDVRSEIESAYREKSIRVLACTTTLAEGVNLPIQTFILGYHQTFGKHRLSVGDFKNIMGRAGRALIETEGRIIAIRHPEFAKDDEDAKYFESLTSLDESKLVVTSEFPQGKDPDDHQEVIAELNRLAQSIGNAQDLADLEYVEGLADEVQRLQVFIFSFFEDGIVDTSLDSVNRALEHTLFFTQQPDNEARYAINRLSQKFATICSQMDKNRLRRFNTSGMHYRSNVRLEQLAERIAERWDTLTKEQRKFRHLISRDDLEFILENIDEAKPKPSEYRSNQYKLIETIDHYGVLIAWISGNSFSKIRDRFFIPRTPKQPRLFYIPDSPTPVELAIRTEACQRYISNQFTFKLPWTLSALHTHAQQFGNPSLNLWLETAPAQVKYGVDTPEAVWFCSRGIRSRTLARKLAEMYRNDKGILSSGDWQSLGEWLSGLSPFYLEDKASDLPVLARRQAIRRANTIRRPSKELRRRRRVLFHIAGWKRYNGERFIDELFERVWDGQGALVSLQTESDNKYDEYAVSVHWGTPSLDNKLGYVPRTHNEEIALLLTLGRQLRSTIIEIGSEYRSDGSRLVQVQVELDTEDELIW